ncbi:MAG: hypothetical protein EHM79_05885 [Geobacter sp.]|nr:MAG: hypothetical protein EHM79_05885 [Geobacter sp.]
MTRNPISEIRMREKKLFNLLPFIVILIMSVSLGTGCIKRNAPSTIVKRYTFEYPSPEFTGVAHSDQTIKIERFSVAKAFNSQSMVFRPEPYQLDTYASDRWMTNPGDMVSDYLLRDLRNSGLFKAAYSYRDLEDARYVLEGSVDEFLEVDNEGTRTAIITLSLTLLDFSRSGSVDRLLFQKRYQASEPFTERTPTGLANAMSTGMGKLSAMIIRDILQSVQTP